MKAKSFLLFTALALAAFSHRALSYDWSWKDYARTVSGGVGLFGQNCRTFPLQMQEYDVVLNATIFWDGRNSISVGQLTCHDPSVPEPGFYEAVAMNNTFRIGIESNTTPPLFSCHHNNKQKLFAYAYWADVSDIVKNAMEIDHISPDFKVTGASPHLTNPEFDGLSIISVCYNPSNYYYKEIQIIDCYGYTRAETGENIGGTPVYSFHITPSSRPRIEGQLTMIVGGGCRTCPDELYILTGENPPPPGNLWNYPGLIPLRNVFTEGDNCNSQQEAIISNILVNPNHKYVSFQIRGILEGILSDSIVLSGAAFEIPTNRDPDIYVRDRVVNEGSWLEFTVGANDPDGDLVTLQAESLPNWLRVIDNNSEDGPVSFAVMTVGGVYGDNDYWTAKFKAVDNAHPEEPGVKEGIVNIRVDNVPPHIDHFGSDSPLGSCKHVGDWVLFTGDFYDRGWLDTHQVIVNFGDTHATNICNLPGKWFIRDLTSFQFGLGCDIPVPADYRGDVKSEAAVFRVTNDGSGFWTIKGVTEFYFGKSGDVPVPGDYNGDGNDDAAIFRPSSSLWAVGGITRVYYGAGGDIPIPADYDGNGTTDIAVFRPRTGQWFIRGITKYFFGTSGDIPVPKDYYGGIKDDIAIFRPSNGRWVIRDYTAFWFGTEGDIPVPADYVGNSKIVPYRKQLRERFDRVLT